MPQEAQQKMSIDNDWKSIREAGGLSDSHCTAIEEIVKKFRIDVSSTLQLLNDLETPLGEAKVLFATLLEQPAHCASLNLLPEIRAERIALGQEQIASLAQAIHEALVILRHRRSLETKTPTYGPIRDLIRYADNFWLSFKGERIQSKGKDHRSWAFLDALAKAVAPKMSSETLRKYFQHHESEQPVEDEFGYFDEPKFSPDLLASRESSS